MVPGCTIERYRPGFGDTGELTSLLHRAHAPLIAGGMNFIAATQSPDVTEKRLSSSSAAWIAVDGKRIIGTILYYSCITNPRRPAWFSSDDVGVFAQFAVEPALQKRGIGSQLLDAVEHYARAEGKSELACDTAEPATQLLAYYARRGFRQVAVHQYPDATYNSVILSKRTNGAS